MYAVRTIGELINNLSILMLLLLRLSLATWQKIKIKRLTEMFLNYKGQNLKKPHLIIINNDHNILKNSQIDINKYCIAHNQKFISAYLKKDLC